MKQLLKTNEQRHLELIEYLYDRQDWTPLAEIATTLNYSERTLKTDINRLRKSLDSLIIDSSSIGFRLLFKENTNLKSFYQMIFEQSTTFNLLEYLVTHESTETEQILDVLSISLSTLYRLIKKINDVLEENFQITINQTDYQLLGEEKDIRYFYYVYFSERFPRFDWGFQTIDEEAIEILLHVFIDILKLPLDYSSYITYKNIVTVNLFRYRQNYKMPLEQDLISFKLEKHQHELSAIEKSLDIALDTEAFNQLFYNFIHTDFVIDYKALTSKIKDDKDLDKNVKWLSAALDELSKAHDLPLPNKEDILVKMMNATYCEKFTPQSGYLLYNRIKLDVRRFKENFPKFSKDVSEVITHFNKIAKQPSTKYTMDYLFFSFSVEWKNLSSALYNKLGKIKILLISDLSQGHANTLKNILEFSFSNQLDIELFKGTQLVKNDLDKFSYDILIANFPLPESNTCYNLSIENIPTPKDLKKISDAIERFYL